jgi:hypothetical protein
VVIPGAYIVAPSFSKYMAYQVGTSRCPLCEKPRQSQRSLKVATMRVLVRTSYREIASGGSTQTQCPIRRRTQDTPGPWMSAHLQLPVLVTFSRSTGVATFPFPNRNFLSVTQNEKQRPRANISPHRISKSVFSRSGVYSCSPLARNQVLTML